MVTTTEQQNKTLREANRGKWMGDASVKGEKAAATTSQQQQQTLDSEHLCSVLFTSRLAEPKLKTPALAPLAARLLGVPNVYAGAAVL